MTHKYDIIQDGYPIVSVALLTDIFKNDYSDFHPIRPPFCILPLTCSYKGTQMKPYSQEEFCLALNSLNIKSSPGHDGIYMKWIFKSPKRVHTALLSLYNYLVDDFTLSRCVFLQSYSPTWVQRYSDSITLTVM